MAGQWDNLRLLRQEYSKENITERISFYAIEKLKKLGYDCELVKPNQKVRSWRVLPKNRSEMSKQDLETFEQIKQKIADDLKDEERQAIKEMRRSILGA